MGIVFETEDGKCVLDISERYAHLFTLLTQGAAVYHKLPMPLSEIRNDTCLIQETHFCKLVEAVFDQPIDLLYAWARRAAGMYEVINGETYWWEWALNQTPTVPFQPIRQVGLMPQNFSGKALGSPQ